MVISSTAEAPFSPITVPYKRLLTKSNPYYGKSYTKERGIAFFSQATYTYNNRYVLAGTLNYEGTNQLGRSRSARWLPTWNIPVAVGNA